MVLQKNAFIILLLLLVILPACKSNSQSGNSTIKDTPNQSNIYIPKDAVVVYIAKPNSKLFKYPDSKSSIFASFTIGDSIYVDCGKNALCDYFGEKWYIGFAVQENKIIQGYIQGKNIGKGFFTDIDNDNINELFIAGYKNYKEETEKDLNWNNPARLLLVKNKKLISAFDFKGYSAISLTPLGNRGFPNPNKFFLLEYGLQACDYDNADLLLHWNGNKLNLIAENHGACSTYAGLDFNYIFPLDSSGKPNQIKVVASLIYNKEEAEPEDKDQSDTSIYKLANGSFILSYKSKKPEK